MLHALTRGFTCVSRLCSCRLCRRRGCDYPTSAWRRPPTLQTGSAAFDQDLANVKNVVAAVGYAAGDSDPRPDPQGGGRGSASSALIIMGWEMTHSHEDTAGHLRRIGGFCVVAAVLLFGVSFIRGLGLTGNGALIHF